MIENKNCNYCGWKFPQEYLRKITENNESLFCENCGTEILKESDENAEEDKINDENNNKKGFFSRIYETVRNEKNPIERVLMDSDTPQNFKDNLKIVVSRLLFPHIRALESEPTQDNENMELTEVILDDLYEKISPIINQRIKDIFLINLNNLSVKEFNKWLKFLQEKIELNKSFHKDFIIYLRWMIKEVFIIISELWDATDIPRFERIIRDDLKFFEAFLLCSSSSLPIGILENIKNLSLNFKNPDILAEKAIEVFNDLIKGPKNLSIEDLPAGYRSNPKYFVSALIYFGLRHEEYNFHHPEYRFHGILGYIETNYPNDATMKTAISNIVPKVYDYLSDSLKFRILYYPRKGHNVKKEIKEKVKKLKDEESAVIFLSSLKASIKKFSVDLPSSEKISKIALDILEDAIKSPTIFSYNEIITKNIWFNSPEVFAVCFLFLGYHHDDFQATNLLKISEFSEKYFIKYKDSLQANVSFIYFYISDGLKNKIKYLPTQFKKKEHPDQGDNRETWRILKNLFEIFKIDDQEKYIKSAKQIFTLAKQNGYDPKGVVRPHYLAGILLYFTLLKEEHQDINKKKVINTLKSTIYSIWDKGFYKATNEFGSYVSINHAIIKYDFQKFNEKLLAIRKKYRNENRTDNIILIDLLLESLKFCKSNFKDFIDKLALIIAKKKKPSAIIEKLLIPNTFDKISKLEDFVKNYKSFIEKLLIKQNEKNGLYHLLNQFEKSKKEFYNFEENRLEKKKRENIRYKKYRQYFHSHKVRVKRFILMLGFSPFDGFDIWGNKIFIKGRYRIYANFHHLHYNPEGQSESDLVFIPIKPPKKIRNGEYLTKNYLSHNSISGLEGNLKRNDISEETRSRILNKLQRIESFVDYNSILLEKAVYTQNHEVLYDLKNWSIDDIYRALERLKDDSFSWAKRIEDYLPTADGYNRNRIDDEERESIIRRIIDKRGKL